MERKGSGKEKEHDNDDSNDEYEDVSGDDGWNIAFEDLKIIKTIGKGNFGKVYQGLYMGETEVAIKQLYYVDDDDMQKYIEREMATLKYVFYLLFLAFLSYFISLF